MIFTKAQIQFLKSKFSEIDEIEFQKDASNFLLKTQIERNKDEEEILKKFKKLQGRFHDVIKGYHMVNKTPIKESIWEEINCQIVRDVMTVSDEANGNHISGKDNRFDDVNFSNKTGKISGNYVNISSYRLSKICNYKDIGTAQDIINEIYERDKSFDYYSILLRVEKENSIISYNWYIIPRDYYLFKIDKLIHKIGKRGRKNNQIIGWESKYCDISFSMSSQLWYKFTLDDIEKYKVCCTEIDNNIHKINYSDIFHSFANLSLHNLQ